MSGTNEPCVCQYRRCQVSIFKLASPATIGLLDRGFARGLEQKHFGLKMILYDCGSRPNNVFFPNKPFAMCFFHTVARSFLMLYCYTHSTWFEAKGQ